MLGEEARGERVVFRAIEPIDSPPPPVRIILCAALIKFDRFEWIVEKATELGIERILPFEAARSEKGLLEASRKRAQRWERIARKSSSRSSEKPRRWDWREHWPVWCWEESWPPAP